MRKNWKKGEKRNPLLSMATTIETQYTAINLKKHFFTSIDYLNLFSFYPRSRALAHSANNFNLNIQLKICVKKKYWIFEGIEFDQNIYMFIR